MAVKAQAQVEITSVKDIKDAAEAARDTAASSKITADSAATAAGTAQTAADAAQSIADSAGKAARDAQTKAEAADAKADKAAKTATDYLYSNNGDLVIAEKDPAEPAKGNLKIMGDGIAIRNGDKTLADYSGSSAKFYGVATEVEKLTTQPSDWGSSAYLWKYARVPSRPTFNGGLLTEAPISADWSKLTWNYIKATKPVSWGSLGVILLNFDKDTVWPKGHGLTVTFETPNQDGTLYFDSTKDESMMVQFRPAGGSLTNITKDVAWKYTGKISQADALSVTKADYIYSYTNTQKGEINWLGEFYRFTGSAMTRINFAGAPSFVDGTIYRRSDYQSAVPVSAIQSAGITLSYGSNLYYRPSVQYGQANSTPKDYAGYYKFVDGRGMQTVSTGTLPEWVDNYIYTASPDEFRKVPEALGSLTFIPNLFYRETTVYTQTAEFGSTGATIGPKQGGHATFTADGMTVYIGDEAEASNKVAFFGKNSILNLIYPVGSIYMSTNATSPETLFGGTWERIQDRFLLAAGSTYNAGDRDGEATHTLTVDELPDHRHAFTTDSAGRHDHRAGYKRKDAYGKGTLDGQHWSNYNAGEVRTTSEGAHTHTGTTNGAGGTQPHNNMPPYLVVNVWERTA